MAYSSGACVAWFRCAKRWGAACCCLTAFFVMAMAVQGQTPRLTPSQVPIPPTFFGMHVHMVIGPNGPDPRTPWPQVSVPAWRLWDVRVTWSDIEPAKGQWNFGVLDKIVALAREHNTELQLTFGFTPTWASARPAETSFYHPGGASEPLSLNDWEDFVRTVVVRYQGQIHIYEIWNEPNVRRYWSGSPEQMVELTHRAHDIIKSIDPSATIVSPPPAGILGLVWFSSFLSAGGGRYVDVIGYHFYVDPAPPETMVPFIQTVQAIMRAYHCEGEPIWDTEAGWSNPRPFPSDELGAAYVARAFLLNWASGVRRFYWYGWNAGGGPYVPTTEADGKTLKPEGAAYGIIQKWLTGAVMNWCGQDANHTWTCQLTDRGTTKWVVWNPDQNTCLTVPSGWAVKKVTPLLSEPHLANGSCIEIGSTPDLLTR